MIFLLLQLCFMVCCLAPEFTPYKTREVLLPYR